ncbi:MAG TPA: hypothetical protein VIR45_08165, partial [Kiloniellaceae bacterium]
SGSSAYSRTSMAWPLRGTSSCASGSGSPAAARWLLYVRAHYLRMPLPLLLPHLLRKSLHRPDHSRENEAQRSLQARVEELLRLTPSRDGTRARAHEP